MNLIDHFQYVKTLELPEIKLLNAFIRDFKYIRHSHDDYAIGVTMKGYQSYFCDGSYYKNPTGGIMLFNPDEVHDGYSQDQEGFKYFMVYIPRDHFIHTLEDMYGNKIIDFKFNENQVFDEKLKQKVFSLVTALTSNKKDSLLTNELYVDLLQALYHRNTNKNVDSLVGDKKDGLILRAMQLINENVRHQLTLDEICSEMNISKFYFIRLFKKQVGITPYQYILDVKMKAASEELIRGQDLIKIVNKYGFYDLSHFHKRFRKVFGVTPLDYQTKMF